jgi:hypothetical protein
MLADGRRAHHSSGERSATAAAPAAAVLPARLRVPHLHVLQRIRANHTEGQVGVH